MGMQGMGGMTRSFCLKLLFLGAVSLNWGSSSLAILELACITLTEPHNYTSSSTRHCQGPGNQRTGWEEAWLLTVNMLYILYTCNMYYFLKIKCTHFKKYFSKCTYSGWSHRTNTLSLYPKSCLPILTELLSPSMTPLYLRLGVQTGPH